MSKVQQLSQLTAEDFDRWIKISGESDFIDAKAPMQWDGADKSAALAKDIVGFANSRDGGVLVIGKSQRTDGTFDFEGLTSDQLATFDTTRVADWINSRFSPPVRLSCYTHEYLGKQFVLIVIQEFDDVPSLCVKSFQSSIKPNVHIIREGSIYIRKANAASGPISSLEEWRTLIGLATRKRGEELITLFDDLLKGRSLQQQPDDLEQFATQRALVALELKLPDENDANRAGWRIVLHPISFAKNRWNRDNLINKIRESAVHLIDEFPGYERGAFPMNWGIANKLYGEAWALTTSGMFLFWKEFRENEESPQSVHGLNFDSRKALAPGEWIEFQWNMRIMIEFFVFASRFASLFDPGEAIRYAVKASSLEGRRLITTNFRVNLFPRDASHAGYFEHERSLPAAEFRAEWKNLCAVCMKDFFDLFPGPSLSLDVMRQWVDKFEQRRF